VRKKSDAKLKNSERARHSAYYVGEYSRSLKKLKGHKGKGAFLKRRNEENYGEGEKGPSVEGRQRTNIKNVHKKSRRKVRKRKKRQGKGSKKKGGGAEGTGGTWGEGGKGTHRKRGKYGEKAEKKS